MRGWRARRASSLMARRLIRTGKSLGTRKIVWTRRKLVVAVVVGAGRRERARGWCGCVSGGVAGGVGYVVG